MRKLRLKELLNEFFYEVKGEFFRLEFIKNQKRFDIIKDGEYYVFKKNSDINEEHLLKEDIKSTNMLLNDEKAYLIKIKLEEGNILPTIFESIIEAEITDEDLEDIINVYYIKYSDIFVIDNIKENKKEDYKRFLIKENIINFKFLLNQTNNRNIRHINKLEKLKIRYTKSISKLKSSIEDLENKIKDIQKEIDITKTNSSTYVEKELLKLKELDLRLFISRGCSDLKESKSYFSKIKSRLSRTIFSDYISFKEENYRAFKLESLLTMTIKIDKSITPDIMKKLIDVIKLLDIEYVIDYGCIFDNNVNPALDGKKEVFFVSEYAEECFENINENKLYEVINKNK